MTMYFQVVRCKCVSVQELRLLLPVVTLTIEDDHSAFIFINLFIPVKVSKGVKIRNRYNQVTHLIKNTNRKVTNSQLDTTNESREVSSFPAGDRKAQINRRSQRHNKHKTEKHK